MTPQNMVHSAEARWFWEGNQNDMENVRQWFVNVKGSAFPAKEEKLRVDNYLIFPACDSVGVKLRGGTKFEVKSLVASPRPFSGLGFQGRTDQWVKWSFEEKEKDKTKQHLLHLAVLMTNQDRWLTVNKWRFLRKLDADHGPLQEVDPDAYPDCGCNIELTRLEVNATTSHWFSFAFEAFGPVARVAQILDEAVPLFLSQQTSVAMELGARNSLSYPAWLATLTDSGTEQEAR